MYNGAMTHVDSTSVQRQQALRSLPAVDALLRTPAIAALSALHGADATTAAARATVAAARTAIQQGEPAPAGAEWPTRVAAQLELDAAPSLFAVVNATGVIIHTNLGRAPLSAAALAAIGRIGGGYTNLEYDLIAGERGSRYDHARRLLCDLTGAEDALVCNNNAAAVYLTLAAHCQDRAVLISRSQLVEIGGGFRIPDVLRQSGAHLVEVGTTNRTHLADFAAAVTPATAAILRVHSSNFRQIGFVAMPGLGELAALAHERALLLIDDLGSGTLLDTAPFGLAPEPTVQDSIAAGADLVTFSGDKLLGGPQAGIIVGAAAAIAALRRHPLARALRVDKLTLAALEATLQSYRRGRALEEIPVWRMIAAATEQLGVRAAAWQARLAGAGIAADIWPGESAVGGGSLPGETLPTHLLAVAAPAPDELAAALRARRPAIVCRIQRDHLLFDPRTVLPEQEEYMLTEVVKAVKMTTGA